MKTQAGVDVEGKIEDGCALVDHHGRPVPAENLDLGFIGVTGLDRVDGPLKKAVFAGPPAGPVAVIVLFCPDEEAVEVVPLIRQQEVGRIPMGRAPVIDDIKPFPGEDQVKVFEKEIVWADGGPRLLQIIGDGQEEVVEGEGLLVQEPAYVPDPVRGACSLAEETDHRPVRVFEADDVPVIGIQVSRIAVAQRVKDVLQPVQGLFRRHAVLRVDPAAGLLHLRELGRVLDAEAQVLHPVHEVKGLGLLGQSDQHLSSVLCFEKPFFLTEAGDRGQVVDPVRDLHIEGPGIGLVQELRIRQDVALFFRQPVAVIILVAEGGDRIDGLRDLAAEHLPDLAQLDIAVLHHIVEEGGDQAVTVKAVLRQQAGRPQRMVDIGLSGLAPGPAVLFLREQIGALDPVPVSAGMLL